MMLKLQTNEKEVQMPKLGFLPNTMRAQEGSCIRRILHTYSSCNLRMHKLKNKYTHARTSLRIHEYRLHAQEHVYARRP